MNRRRADARVDRGPQGPWLVISAWPPELAAIRAAGPRLPRDRRRKLVLASVGVGLVEAAIETTRLLHVRRPAAILLVGTAGVYPGRRHELPIGAAAAIGSTTLLPQAVPALSVALPALVPAREPASAQLLRALVRATALPTAKVACPLAITTSERGARSAARLSGCDLENLEAFAVARAAAAAGVPFAGILGISNTVGPDGHRQWRRHGATAAAAAAAAALDFLAAVWPGPDTKAPTAPTPRRRRGQVGPRRPPG